MRLVIAAATCVLAASAAGEPVDRPQPYLLVALPSLGSVTWRCGATDGVYALGYREFWSSATTTVTLRAHGRTVASRSVDPRQVVRFPFVRARVQRLTFPAEDGARDASGDRHRRLRPTPDGVPALPAVPAAAVRRERIPAA